MSKKAIPSRFKNQALTSGFGASSAVFEEHKEDDIHPQIIKMARKSGQLNLSNQMRTKIPEKVFHLNELGPDEVKLVNVNMDSTDDENWWDRSELTKLILSSNTISEIDPQIKCLMALQHLDISDNRLVSLPPEINELKSLQKLNVSHNDLVEIPSNIGNLDELRQLAVNHNNLKAIPDGIGSLYIVEEMDLSHNILESIPSSIGYLQRLSKLTLSDNKLKKLPVELGDMFGLVHIDLTRNQLASIPESVGNLPKLETLALRQNRLDTFPVLHCPKLKEIYLGENRIKTFGEEHLSGILALTFLDLSDNLLDELPHEITLLQSIQRIDISNNSVSSIPCHLGFLPQLKSLGLNGNPLRNIRRDIIQRGTVQLLAHLAQKALDPINTYPGFSDTAVQVVHEGPTVPDQFQMRQSGVMAFHEKLGTIPQELLNNGKEARVRTADLADNKLKELPEGLSEFCDFLQDITLSRNQLSSLPAFLGNFKYLHFLDLQVNHLSTLPDELSRAKGLREVNISFNRFTSIPACLFEAENLEILMASENKIESIDVENLSKLPRLATLDLTNNDVDFVPPVLGKMEQLKSLKLEGNRFRVPRIAILQKGTRELLEYLRSRIVEH